MHKVEQKKKEKVIIFYLINDSGFTTQNIVFCLLFSHYFTSGWILGKNLLHFCFIKTFSKLLFGFPFVLNPIIVVKQSSRKANYQCSYILWIKIYFSNAACH